MLFFKTKPVVKRIVISDPDFKKIARLRYRIYCEELGFLNKEKYPNRQETDEYDGHSIHIVVRVGRRFGGYARVILPNNKGLPVFEHFDLPEEKDMEHSCEISRFMISKAYRHKKETRREIFRLLATEILQIIKEHQNKVIYAVVEEWLYASLVKRGFNFTKIAPSKHHMGAETFPIKLVVDQRILDELPD